MRVKYKTKKVSSMNHYELVEVEFCCEDMKKAWEDYFVHFGSFPDDSFINGSNAVNIYRCYPEGVVEEMPIRYCPFCGKKIVVEEVLE